MHSRHLETGATITSTEGTDQDPTRRIAVPDDRPGQRPGMGGGSVHPSPDTSGAPPTEPGDRRTDGPEVHGGAGPRRGRDLGFATLGAVLGILSTFVVIALTTGGEAGDPGTDEAVAAELEAELAERERRIDELDARVVDLESQLADVSDDRADGDAELAAQREALDDRLEAIEARVEELDNRQNALDERTADLDRREAELADTEAGTDTPPDTGGDGDGGTDLDELGDAAEGVIDRVLDEIRNLFGRDGG